MNTYPAKNSTYNSGMMRPIMLRGMNANRTAQEGIFVFCEIGYKESNSDTSYQWYAYRICMVAE